METLTIEKAAKKHSKQQPYGVWEDNAVESFKAGVEFAQRWISVEDELPNPGDDIILKLREHPLKKYQVWHIADDYNIMLVPVYATHWRPIELK